MPGDYNNAKLRLSSDFLLEYRDEGTGPKTLVFLHGLNAHSGTFRKNTPHFSKSFRVIAPTFPPARVPVPTSVIDDYTGYLEELLTNLGIADAVVVGNSMGGWIAMTLAVSYSGIVNALVLEDTAGFSIRAKESSLAQKVDSTRIPTLIVWGEKDEVIPLKTAEMLHSQIRESRLLVVPGAGHVPHWERPEAFNQVVETFLVDHRLT